MRRRRLCGAFPFGILVGGLAAAVFAIAAFAAPHPRIADRGPNAVPVDIELILAVDISYSMDPDEQALQREGYIQALTSKEFLTALREGAHGKIAISYFEWAGQYDRRVVIPWRLIEGPESADAFAAELARAPYRRASRTSISGALKFAKPMFETSGYRGLRRVIDVSGDGANNSGALVAATRDEVIQSGITINGLPIMLKRSNFGSLDIEALDIYYEDCVIGGPGAFVVPIRERSKFIEATRTKLVLEIAGRQPRAHIVPASAAKPRVSCTIGEKLWQERWGGGDDFQ
ncbi:MAG: DUF1194 domain-containing protein [Pseudolabrys sp.]|nr:DUF1194 domain-containing protein [Pseudolabrys sp.]